MKLPHEKFCILPWVGTEVCVNGRVKPCCMYDDYYQDDNGQEYNLKNDYLTDTINCEQIKSVRRDFLAGKMPEKCYKCVEEEDVGKLSKRELTIIQAEKLNITPPENWGEEVRSSDLQFLDLKLGNICNLKCRICKSSCSSSFAVEEIKFDTKHKAYHQDMLKKGNWIKENKHFWKEMNFIAEQIRYVEFAGGEPFMIREQFEFLEFLIRRGLSKNITIHYNTNGTQWPEKYINFWKEFKEVNITFSIDDIGKRFEYERKNASWDKVNQNIKNAMAFKKLNNNIHIQLRTTVNIYNILYLDKFIQWEKFNNFEYVDWGTLFDPEEQCIKYLPIEIKEIVKEKLSKTGYSGFQSIIQFMNSSDEDRRDDIIAGIEEFDKRRNENLMDSHLELYKLLYKK